MKLKSYDRLREQIYYDKLDNGLPVYVIKKPGFVKKYACFMTNYGGADRRFKLGGKWMDTPAGVAHFLEHKMFDMPDGSNTLAVLSANGASPNASTSDSLTTYHFECVDNFFINLETLLKYVSTPYFTKESVAKEQGIIAQEIRMTEDSPDFSARYGLLKMLCKYNPVRDSVAGTVESIMEITPETLYHCHEIFYNPTNMCLAVAGDVDPEEVFETARRIITAPSGERPQRDYGEAETFIPEQQRGERVMPVSLPIFFMGTASAADSSGEAYFREVVVRELAVNIVTGRSSPFFQRLYAERKFLSFSGGIMTSPGVISPVFAGLAPDSEAVYDELMREIERVSNAGVDVDLFERLKKTIYGGNMRAFDSFPTVCNSISAWHLRNFDWMRVLDVVESINPEEMTESIKTHLTPDKFAMFTVKPPSAQ